MSGKHDSNSPFTVIDTEDPQAIVMHNVTQWRSKRKRAHFDLTPTQVEQEMDCRKHDFRNGRLVSISEALSHLPQAAK